MAFNNGCIRALGWDSDPRSSYVVDWPHQVPDPGVFNLDDRFPWCDGQHHSGKQSSCDRFLVSCGLDDWMGRGHCSDRRTVCSVGPRSWGCVL